LERPRYDKVVSIATLARMESMWIDAALVIGSTFAGVLAVALGLTFFGKHVAGVVTRAPGLDVVVATLTWVPWAIAIPLAGWIGLPAAIVGQMLALFAWCWIHEAMHPQFKRGPRIVVFLNRTVGRWQNHLALWVTLVALPGFWAIRILELFLYWLLPVLLNFPRYRQGEWVNVSRHKFDGLVGHDLIWCLYCDWMTGVYSLGAEMLRNVESFWCPIRFYDGKKCANCVVDFPDIDGGWVKETGTMADVVATMETKYADGERAWFGHPVRLTVKGKEPQSPAQPGSSPPV
jgi:hypothetical protein